MALSISNYHCLKNNSSTPKDNDIEKKYNTLIYQYFQTNVDHPQYFFVCEKKSFTGCTSLAQWIAHVYRELIQKNCLDIIECIFNESGYKLCYDISAIIIVAVELEKYFILTELKNNGFDFACKILIVEEFILLSYYKVNYNALDCAIQNKDLSMCKFLVEEIGINPSNPNLSNIVAEWDGRFCTQSKCILLHVNTLCKILFSKNEEITQYFLRLKCFTDTEFMIALRWTGVYREYNDLSKQIIDEISDIQLVNSKLIDEIIVECTELTFKLLIEKGFELEQRHLSLICKDYHEAYGKIDIFLEEGFELTPDNIYHLIKYADVIKSGELLIKYSIDLSQVKLIRKESKFERTKKVIDGLIELGMDKDELLYYLSNY